MIKYRTVLCGNVAMHAKFY